MRSDSGVGNTTDGYEVEIVLTCVACNVVVVVHGTAAGGVCQPVASTELDVVSALLAFNGNEANKVCHVIVGVYAFGVCNLVNY